MRRGIQLRGRNRPSRTPPVRGSSVSSRQGAHTALKLRYSDTSMESSRPAMSSTNTDVSLAQSLLPRRPFQSELVAGQDERRKEESTGLSYHSVASGSPVARARAPSGFRFPGRPDPVSARHRRRRLACVVIPSGPGRCVQPPARRHYDRVLICLPLGRTNLNTFDLPRDCNFQRDFVGEKKSVG